MKSQVYWGSILHERSGIEPHRFAYPIFIFGIDLAEREQSKSWGPLFGSNRLSVFSLREKDYLTAFEGSLQERVRHAVGPDDETDPAVRCTLVTMARYFGYVFNPVSFFVRHREDGSFHSMLVEVHNTFGEGHLYALRPSKRYVPGEPMTFQFDKQFFVSPFFDVSGGYELTVSACADNLDISVALNRETGANFRALLSGKGRPISTRSLLATLCRYSLTTLLTMPRIHHEALKLNRKKGVKIYEKPAPSHPATTAEAASAVHRIRLFLLRALQRRT